MPNTALRRTTVAISQLPRCRSNGRQPLLFHPTKNNGECNLGERLFATQDFLEHGDSTLLTGHYNDSHKPKIYDGATKNHESDTSHGEMSATTDIDALQRTAAELEVKARSIIVPTSIDPEQPLNRAILEQHLAFRNYACTDPGRLIKKICDAWLPDNHEFVAAIAYLISYLRNHLTATDSYPIYSGIEDHGCNLPITFLGVKKCIEFIMRMGGYISVDDSDVYAILDICVKDPIVQGDTICEEAQSFFNQMSVNRYQAESHQNKSWPDNRKFQHNFRTNGGIKYIVIIPQVLFLCAQHARVESVDVSAISSLISPDVDDFTRDLQYSMQLPETHPHFQDRQSTRLSLDLSSTVISNCQFIWTRMKKSRIINCHLISVKLTHASCAESRFFDTTLECVTANTVDFDKVIFNKTKFNNCQLNYVRIIGADFSNAEFDQETSIILDFRYETWNFINRDLVRSYEEVLDLLFNHLNNGTSTLTAIKSIDDIYAPLKINLMCQCIQYLDMLSGGGLKQLQSRLNRLDQMLAHMEITRETAQANVDKNDNDDQSRQIISETESAIKQIKSQIRKLNDIRTGIKSVIPAFIDILTNNPIYYADDTIRVFMEKQLFSHMITQGNTHALTLSDTQIRVFCDYLQHMADENTAANFITHNNGFFNQLVYAAQVSSKPEIKSLCHTLYNLAMAACPILQTVILKYGPTAGFFDKKDTVETMIQQDEYKEFQQEQLILLSVGQENKTLHFLCIESKYLGRFMHNQSDHEHANIRWNNFETYTYTFGEEVALVRDTPKLSCEHTFKRFILFAHVYKAAQQSTQFNKLFLSLKLGHEYEPHFLKALNVRALVREYGDRHPQQYITPEHKKNLFALIAPHLVLPADKALSGESAKAIMLTQKHKSDVIKSFTSLDAQELTEETLGVGTAAGGAYSSSAASTIIESTIKQTQLFLCLAGIFAKYSSSNFFGSPTDSPEALRAYAYALLNTAKQYNDQLPENHKVFFAAQFNDYANRLLGIGDAFQCSAVLSDMILQHCQSNFSEFAQILIPPAWA